jgi:hypothetical protein
MNYFVKRGAEQLGPFSLADLQQQLQAGKISPGDLAKSEGMNDWAMVSQVVGNISVPVAAYGVAAAPAMEPVATVDLPPNLHWVVILMVNIFAQWIPFGFLFNVAWTFVLAIWARKLDGNINTLILVTMYPAGFVAGTMALILFPGPLDTRREISAVLIIGGLIAYIFGVFKIKAAMEEYYNSTENMGLRLSGVMTFFFSTIYLQYHVNEIAKWKKTIALA